MKKFTVEVLFMGTLANGQLIKPRGNLFNCSRAHGLSGGLTS